MPRHMPELLRHRHDGSPFSEAIRLILGRKRLAWRAVEQPNMMPRPALVPLAGGYRRIPVLHVGADVCCDSRQIALRRSGPQLGEIVVHFPRAGFRVREL